MVLEKRKFERIPAKVVGDYLLSSREESKLKSNIIFTRDISLGGAKVVTQIDIKSEEHFTLILHLPTCFLPILARSRISWMREIDVSKCKISNTKEAGIEFIKVEPPDESKLRNFLAAREKQDKPKEACVGGTKYNSGNPVYEFV